MPLCRSLLDPGDILMCVSFNDSLKKTKVFRRLTQYFTEVLKSHGNPYTTLSHSYYENLEGFQLKKRDDGFTLGNKLQVLSTNIVENDILNEHFYVMERT